MTRHSLVAVSVLALLVACDGKTDTAGTPAVDSTATMRAVVPDTASGVDSAAATVPDTAAKAAVPSTKPAPKPAAKPETGDHDIAIRPKFRIDEKTGKIDTIKRP